MPSCTSLVKWISFLASSLMLCLPIWGQGEGWLPDLGTNQPSRPASRNMDREPPPRIAGGLVQQLRSLTDDVFGSKSSNAAQSARKNPGPSRSKMQGSASPRAMSSSRYAVPPRSDSRASQFEPNEAAQVNSYDAPPDAPSRSQYGVQEQFSDRYLPPQPTGTLVLDSKARVTWRGAPSHTQRNIGRDAHAMPPGAPGFSDTRPRAPSDAWNEPSFRQNDYDPPLVSQLRDAVRHEPKPLPKSLLDNARRSEVQASEFVASDHSAPVPLSANANSSTRTAPALPSNSSRLSPRTLATEAQLRSPQEVRVESIDYQPPQAPKVSRKSIPKRNAETPAAKAPHNSDASLIERKTAPEAIPTVSQPPITGTRNSGQRNSEQRSAELRVGEQRSQELRTPEPKGPIVPQLPPVPAPLSLSAQASQSTNKANSGPTDSRLQTDDRPSLEQVPPSLSQPTYALPQATTSTPSTSLTAAPARPASLPSARASVPTPVPNREPIQFESATSPGALSMEIPHVQVQLLGPGDLPVGAPANYEVVVQNLDRIVLPGAVVRLEIPSGVEPGHSPVSIGEVRTEKMKGGASELTWMLPRLAAGASARMPLSITVRDPRNFAIAIEWTVIPQSGSKPIEVLQPQLRLALDGPSEVEFAVPHVYRLKVSNPGTAPAKSVTVQLVAEPHGSSTAEIGEILPGQEKTIDVELTFQQRGAVNILADASGAQNLRSQTKIEVKVKQPQLAAELVIPPLVYHGSIAACEVHVTNRGDADATNALATVLLPQNSTLVSRPDGARQSGDKLVWDIERLAAGATATYYLQLNMKKTGTHALQFLCSTPNGIRVAAEGATQVEAIADLKLVVNDPQAPAPVNSEVSYELSLTNRGSLDATGVSVVAQFSDGVEPIRAEGAKHKVVPGQVIFDPINSISAGETVTLKVIAKATVGGMHRFRTEVRCEENQTRLVQEESTRYLDATSRIAAPPSSTIQR